MADIKSSKLLYLKAALFLVVGLLAAGGLLLDQPNLKTMVLLAIAIWAFARLYYFAFYVVEHYINGEYKFAGLFDFLRYLLTRREARKTNRTLS